MPRPSGYRIFRRKVLTKRYVNLEGLPGLYEKLNNVLDSVQMGEVYDLLLKGAYVVRTEARDLAPYQSKRQHPPGWLHIRDAIFATMGDPSKDPKGPTVLVVVSARKAPQAYWIERGTSRMQARPFWRPAVAAARPQVASIYRAGLQDLILKAAEQRGA